MLPRPEGKAPRMFCFWLASRLATPLASVPACEAWRLRIPKIDGPSNPSSEEIAPVPRPVKRLSTLPRLDSMFPPNSELSIPLPD
jgi:hypothetical protein